MTICDCPRPFWHLKSPPMAYLAPRWGSGTGLWGGAKGGVRDIEKSWNFENYIFFQKCLKCVQTCFKWRLMIVRDHFGLWKARKCLNLYILPKILKMCQPKMEPPIGPATPGRRRNWPSSPFRTGIWHPPSELEHFWSKPKKNIIEKIRVA